MNKVVMLSRAFDDSFGQDLLGRGLCDRSAVVMLSRAFDDSFSSFFSKLLENLHAVVMLSRAFDDSFRISQRSSSLSERRVRSLG